ncbi:MAG: response regulator [Gammaproteobacteria bacterium]
MPKRLLIIDDDLDICEVAKMSLEMTGGHEVVTAASCYDGIEKAKETQPDAILLDVMMPDLDGPATFRRLQQEPATRHIPVILLTAKVQAADRRRFLDLGVQGVLAKPFDPMELSNQIAALLGWREPAA